MEDNHYGIQEEEQIIEQNAFYLDKTVPPRSKPGNARSYMYSRTKKVGVSPPMMHSSRNPQSPNGTQQMGF